MSHSRTRVAMAAATVAVGAALAVGLGTLGVFAAHSGATAPAVPVAAAAPLTTTVAPAPAPVTTTPPATTTTTTTTTTTSAPTTTAAPVGRVAGTPCDLPTTGDGACVQISTQKAWLVSDGKVVLAVSSTTGKSGSTTPVGRFSVLWKDIDHKSKQFDDAPMPYSVFFYPGDAFHTGSLKQRSNGCVHLSDSAARTFYNTLQTGDPVQVVR